MKQVIATVLAGLVLAAFAFGMLSLALWLLVPAAFPGLDFSFPNAMALTGIALIVGIPAMRKA